MSNRSLSALPDSSAQRSVTESLLREASGAVGDRRESLLGEAIVQGTPMARSLALRYDGRGVEREELFQVAYVGLVKAAQGYRPGPETDFRSYAFPTIRGELKRHFRDYAWAVRPPRRIQNLQASINAAEGELAAQLRRWPSEQELADRIGVPVGQVRDAQSATGCFHPVSLDAPVRPGTETSLGSLVADDGDIYQLVDEVEALRRAVELLGDRDKQILRRRMIDHWTQAQIAAEIGVSQMQISRILSRIMGTLRTALAA
jgi:RNA polymerase sigma-B factor